MGHIYRAGTLVNSSGLVIEQPFWDFCNLGLGGAMANTTLLPQRLHSNPLSCLHLPLSRSLCRQAIPQGTMPDH